eukprot:scpid27859/ scgid1567/ 
MSSADTRTETELRVEAGKDEQRTEKEHQHSTLHSNFLQFFSPREISFTGSGTDGSRSLSKQVHGISVKQQPDQRLERVGEYECRLLIADLGRVEVACIA